MINYSANRLEYYRPLRKIIFYMSLFLFFFLLSSYENIISQKAYYVPSGGPFFSKISTPFHSWNLPAFTGPIVDILENEDKQYVVVYLILQALFLLLTSHFILFLSVYILTKNSMTAFLTSLFFHTSISVQQVFWSSPTFDFFPKIHLTELWLLMVCKLATTKRSNYRQFTILSISIMTIIFGLLATYIRNSSLPILIAALFIIFFYFKFKLVWLASLSVITLFLVSLRLKQMGSFSFLYFFASSNPVSSQASLGALASIPISPIPLNDGLLAHLLETTYSAQQILIDKFFFAPTWYTVKMQVLNIIQSTSLYDILQNSNIPHDLNISICLVLFIIVVLLLYIRLSSFLRVSFLLFLLLDLTFVFLSRFSPQQQLHLSIFLSLALAQMVSEVKTLFMRHSKGHKPSSGLTGLIFLPHNLSLLKITNFVLAISLSIATFFSLYIVKFTDYQVDNIERLPTNISNNFFSISLPNYFHTTSKNYAIKINAKSSNPLFVESYLPLRRDSLVYYVPISGPNENLALIFPLDESLLPGMEVNFDLLTHADIELEAMLIPNLRFPSAIIVKDKSWFSTANSLSKLGSAHIGNKAPDKEWCPLSLQNFCYVSQIKHLDEFGGNREKCWRSTSHPLILMSSIFDHRLGIKFETVRFYDRNVIACAKFDDKKRFIFEYDIFAWSTLLRNPIVSLETSE